jgi:hypothetical protein
MDCKINGNITLDFINWSVNLVRRLVGLGVKHWSSVFKFQIEDPQV